MPNEDQQLDENEESTLDEKRDSDDTAEDLDSIFADDSDEDNSEKPVTREEYENLKKGAQKLATELGRLKSKDVEKEPREEELKKEIPETNSVMKNLYFKANPEAKEVWDEVEREAKKLSKDPFELYEYSSYFKGEASSRAAAKAEEEANKAKISKPSSDVDFSKKISSIKEEDVNKLTPEQKVQWIKEQVRKEKDAE